MARSTVPSHSRRMVQQIRRQSSKYSAQEDDDAESNYFPDDGALRWTLSKSSEVYACSDYTFSWAGDAQAPFKLTAHQRNSTATGSEWRNLIIAQRIFDAYYTWTVDSPVNATISFTLEDANGLQLDSTQSIQIITNGFGSVAEDTWCQLSKNAVQQDGNATRTSASATASALVTVYPGQNETTVQSDNTPWILVDTYQSQLKKAHAVTGALAALFTLAIILGLVGVRMHMSLRKEYQRLVEDAPKRNDAGTAVNMSHMEKRAIDGGPASQSRRSVISRDDLAFALDRTPSQISATSIDVAAQRRGSDNPFLDSASSSGGLETPRVSGGRVSYISNATSRITGVSNISNEFYHRTKASTIPFKLDRNTASTVNTLLRPSSASTITSSSSSLSRNITAPNAALKKYSHWSATSSERSPSTEEYLTEPDSESSRRGSGSITGLSRMESRESTASTIAPPISAISRTSEADSFQRALGRL